MPSTNAGPFSNTAHTTTSPKVVATKDDIADLRSELKGDVVALGQQVTSIETQRSGMEHGKLETRVAYLEEKVFGHPRG